jgi:hypothetical protein
MVMVAAFPFQHRVEPRPNFYRISQDVNNLKSPRVSCSLSMFIRNFLPHLCQTSGSEHILHYFWWFLQLTCHFFHVIQACQRFFTLQLGIPAVDLWLWPLTEKIRTRHQDYAILCPVCPEMSRSIVSMIYYYQIWIDLGWDLYWSLIFYNYMNW